MPFNTLGARGRYVYTTDTGVDYTVETDTDLATAAGLAAVGATEPPLKPSNIKPRVVFVQATVAGAIRRKELIVNADSTLFTDSRQTVTIDGTAGQTTGRRGERVSF